MGAFVGALDLGERLNGHELGRKAWSVKKRVLRVKFKAKRKVSNLGVIDRSRCGRG